jgi:hypothetical protein
VAVFGAVWCGLVRFFITYLYFFCFRFSGYKEKSVIFPYMKKLNQNYVMVAEKQDAEISFFPLLFSAFSVLDFPYNGRN